MVSFPWPDHLVYVTLLCQFSIFSPQWTKLVHVGVEMRRHSVDLTLDAHDSQLSGERWLVSRQDLQLKCTVCTVSLTSVERRPLTGKLVKPSSNRYQTADIWHPDILTSDIRHLTSDIMTLTHSETGWATVTRRRRSHSSKSELWTTSEGSESDEPSLSSREECGGNSLSPSPPLVTSSYFRNFSLAVGMERNHGKQQNSGNTRSQFDEFLLAQVYHQDRQYHQYHQYHQCALLARLDTIKDKVSLVIIEKERALVLQTGLGCRLSLLTWILWI